MKGMIKTLIIIIVLLLLVVGFLVIGSSFKKLNTNITQIYQNISGINLTVAAPTGWTTTSNIVYNDTNGVAVGIGTNAPAEKLHVVGNAYVSNFINVSDVDLRGNIHFVYNWAGTTAIDVLTAAPDTDGGMLSLMAGQGGPAGPFATAGNGGDFEAVGGTGATGDSSISNIGSGGGAYFLGGAGGFDTNAGGQGAIGGVIQIQGGTGGSTNSGTGALGGGGGPITIQGGSGASVSGSNSRGGVGGQISIVAGSGGSASGTASLGGSGGNVVINGGLASTGGTTGNVLIATTRGNIIAGNSGSNMVLGGGSSAIPVQRLDVRGNINASGFINATLLYVASRPAGSSYVAAFGGNVNVTGIINSTQEITNSVKLNNITMGTCSSVQIGTIAYNYTANYPCFCNGSVWRNMTGNVC